MTNKYSLSWRDHLAWRWSFSAKRREDVRIAVSLAAILLAFGIVGEMDYRAALRAEAERNANNAALNQAALIACLNGGAPWLYSMDDKGRRYYGVCGGDNLTISDEGVKK